MNKSPEQVAKEDALYADEPWAKLATQAGFRPYDTESSARSAFRFCADRITELEAKNSNLLDMIVNEHTRAEALAYRHAQEVISKNGAYHERNKLVALLAGLFPSGIKKTAIEGWDKSWHGCVYIDFPWGQASWHYHDSEAYLFDHLPAYQGDWDGHSTDDKYAAIVMAAKGVGKHVL